MEVCSIVGGCASSSSSSSSSYISFNEVVVFDRFGFRCCCCCRRRSIRHRSTDSNRSFTRPTVSISSRRIRGASRSRNCAISTEYVVPLVALVLVDLFLVLLLVLPGFVEVTCADASWRCWSRWRQVCAARSRDAA